MFSCLKAAYENKVVKLGKNRFYLESKGTSKCTCWEQVYLPSTDHELDGSTCVQLKNSMHKEIPCLTTIPNHFFFKPRI